MLRNTIIALLLLIHFQTIADEGMWLPMFLERLNYAEMQDMGLQLSQEEIYSINNSSIKDAIARLGGGFCTGEIISPSGLMLTNHHCAYDYIQTHSTVERDYLSDGFWAQTYEDELPNEDLYVDFLVRMEDVTNRVLSQVVDTMPEDERNAVVQDAIDDIIEEVKGDSDYKVVVKPFFEGNEYYLFVYETYYDVRLVGAPPESIGKYGGDTDNWMWPRHTGDFALFRVYTGPDGEPAQYSPENIPLKPKHHLPISLDGVSEGDFAMIFGFPGATNRYMTSYGVEMAIEESNPTRVAIRELRLETLKQQMNASKSVRLKYAPKYSRISNYWKYFIGQTKGLKNLNVYEKKKDQEEAFTKWVEKDRDRKAKYGDTFEFIREGYDKLDDVNEAFIYAYEAGLAPEIVSFGYQFEKIFHALNDTSQQNLERYIKATQDQANDFFKDYHRPTDQKVFATMMKMYYDDMDTRFHPDFFQAVKQTGQPDSLRYFQGYKNEAIGDMQSLAAFIYHNSFIADQQKTATFLRNPDAEVLANDPGFKVSQSVLAVYRRLYAQRLQATELIDRGERLYIEGLRKMHPDKFFYPNANSTMRFTYGQVLGYSPKDAVRYNYFTTLKGVMEKEDPADQEFIVHPKLKDLFESGDFGRYGANGQMKVGFLTNTDITGGNSGSPVINGKGQLIGVAFDGNWEAMSGDIAFEPELQRTINVDIRYVLFVIDKFAGADHLIDEMTLVRNKKSKKRRRKKVTN